MVKSGKTEAFVKARPLRIAEGFDLLELQEIAELCHDLIAPVPKEDIAAKVLRSAKRLTGSRLGYVGLMDPETGALVCPTMTTDVWRKCKIKDKRIVFEKFGGLWGWVLAHRKPLMTNCPEADSRSSGTPEGHMPIRSFLSVPALYGKKLVGQIALANSTRPFTATDLERVQRLADLFAAAVHREQTAEQLARAYREVAIQVLERTSELEKTTRLLRRQQKVLKESRKRYHSVVEDQTEVICRVSADGVVTFVNDVYCRFFGKTRSRLLGRKWQTVTLAEDVPMIEARLKTLSDSNPVVRIENRVYSGDGQVRWMEFANRGLFDKKGELVEFQCVGRDVTHRKQAEEELLAYEHIVSFSPDGMSLVGADYRFRIVNDTYLLRYGLDRDQIVGRHAAEIMGPELFERIIKPRFDKCLSGANVAYSDWFSYPGLGRRYMEVRYSPCRGGGGTVIGAVVNVRDATDRELADDALRKSERMLNASQRIAGVGGWEYDARNQSIFWTEETYRIHELDPAELPPGSPDLITRSLACYDEGDRPLIAAAFRRCTAEGTAYDLELPFTTVKGLRRWVRTGAQPVHANGKIDRVIGNIMDITERRRSQEMLEAKLRLSDSAATLSLDELLRKALDEAERLTESRIGFFHFLAEDQKTISLRMWSTNTLQTMCFAEGQGSHYSVDEAGVWVDCIHSRCPVIHNDYAALTHRKGTPPGHAPITRELVVPVLHQDLIVAVLGVGNKRRDYDKRDIEVISALANMIWDVVLRKGAEDELKESRAKLKAMYHDLQSAREAERRRLAREIHDEMGQNLTALKIDLEWMKIRIPAGQTPLMNKIEGMDRLVDQTIETVRRVSSDLRPQVLDSLGLSAAIEWYLRGFEKRTAIECELVVEPEEIKPDPPLATELYRVFQEALTNVVRHAQATSVLVTLKQVGDKLQLRVIDNGIGLSEEKASAPGSFGLLGIRERVSALGGDSCINGLEGEGTALRVTIPIREKGE